MKHPTKHEENQRIVVWKLKVDDGISRREDIIRNQGLGIKEMEVYKIKEITIL